MTDRGSIPLALIQPSIRRREWELRQGEEVRARLRISPFRSGARAEASGRPLRIERRGRLRAEYVVCDETTGEDVARLYRDGRRRLLELGDGVVEWKRISRTDGFAFIGEDGKPLLRAKRISGLTRTSGEVQIDARVVGREALVAALLACYLLIRKSEEEAAAGAATVAAAAS